MSMLSGGTTILGPAEHEATTIRRLKGAAVGAGAILALICAPLALGAVQPKTGYYTTSKGNKSVAFSVAKKGGKLVVTNFTIACSSGSHFGSIFLTKVSPRVSASGHFSYNGPAVRFVSGVPAGAATLNFSGSFVSATKATGKASFSHTTLSGCPGKSFTAKLKK
jgi:hypothetical protein